jgi:hypothetical protein
VLIGFKSRFAEYVQTGSKTHTVRALRSPHKLGYRKSSPRVGEIAHCYCNPRQKSMRLLGRFQIVKVESIVIRSRPGQRSLAAGIGSIEIDGVILNGDEMERFAWMDGFRGNGLRSLQQMSLFWAEQHGCLETFHGQVIHWRFKSAHVEPTAPADGTLSGEAKT